MGLGSTVGGRVSHEPGGLHEAQCHGHESLRLFSLSGCDYIKSHLFIGEQVILWLSTSTSQWGDNALCLEPNWLASSEMRHKHRCICLFLAPRLDKGVQAW